MSDASVRTVGLRLMLGGAVAQLAGLAFDAWTHVRDPDLAEREALVTADNLGHVLLLAGIGAVVLGAALAVLGPPLYRATASRALRAALPAVLIVMMTGTTLAAAESSLGQSHDHGEEAAAADGAAPAATPHEHDAGVGHDHGHGDGTVVPEQPLDPQTRATLADELVRAREVALAHPTVADATRAGYRMVTPYVPLIGAHYMKFLVVDGTFDIAQPEMLLYDGTDPNSKIVGLSYYVRDASAPNGFAGPNDHWHRHLGLCVDPNRIVVIGDEQTTEEECRRRGGVKADGTDGWMVHAWVVPGWESPQGVFSAEHASLR